MENATRAIVPTVAASQKDLVTCSLARITAKTAVDSGMNAAMTAA